MTKKEIVKHISERAKLSQLQTKEVVQMTFDAIIETLVTDGRIELRNFGVFIVKTRKPRLARNPRTGQDVEVEEKNVVTFQAGKIMEERVRKMPLVGSNRRSRKRSEAVAVGATLASDPVSDDLAPSPDLPLKPR